MTRHTDRLMESWAHHWQMPEVSWLSGVESKLGAKQWNEMVKSPYWSVMIILTSVTYWGLANLLEARVLTSSRPLDPRQVGPFRRISRRVVFFFGTSARTDDNTSS